MWSKSTLIIFDYWLLDVSIDVNIDISIDVGIYVSIKLVLGEY